MLDRMIAGRRGPPRCPTDRHRVTPVTSTHSPLPILLGGNGPEKVRGIDISRWSLTVRCFWRRQHSKPRPNLDSARPAPPERHRIWRTAEVVCRERTARRRAQAAPSHGGVDAVTTSAGRTGRVEPHPRRRSPNRRSSAQAGMPAAPESGSKRHQPTPPGGVYAGQRFLTPSDRSIAWICQLDSGHAHGPGSPRPSNDVKDCKIAGAAPAGWSALERVQGFLRSWVTYGSTCHWLLPAERLRGAHGKAAVQHGQEIRPTSRASRCSPAPATGSGPGPPWCESSSAPGPVRVREANPGTSPVADQS